MLRRAIALYHVVSREPYAKASRRHLREAEAAIDLSLRNANTKDFYYEKNRREADKYRAMIRTLATKISRREVSASNAP